MTGSSCDDRLFLPQISLCAATSVNVAATVRALEACLEQIAFADCMLFTDAPIRPAHPEMRVVSIERLRSSAAYSDFLLTRLVDHVKTPYCLIAQWDGHVLNAGHWDPAFLDYDYIGASWPQFDDGHNVGNGGFSLRSRRLMEACRSPHFRSFHPEDLAIGRGNRAWLEELGMRFAPRDLADSFSTERAGHLEQGFGFHGVFHMPQALGMERFWKIYRGLDDRGTVRHDFGAILGDVCRGSGGLARALKLTSDRVRDAVR